ncbi:DUF2946 family protein [Antarcticimicrobium luteum]|uniref:DUF2946 domain-containing protein n=1 Tax=Antarcticimicrobium luteum TaxID=2547397 RepID=A0A4V3AQY2_9RHOB|nr:DUF2946 family protein [Antarcticimicrobium luteum]TDK44487.1 DUF2946 domain-containing protein [Antarcticimicrobium luteum]
MCTQIPNPVLVSATAPRRRRDARPVAALLGVVALILQLLAPGLARASQTDWMEICSEQGVVVVPMDIGGGQDRPQPATPGGSCDCCGFCVTCGGALAAIPPYPVSVATPHGLPRTAIRPEAQTDHATPRAVWPSPRGPPPAPENPTDRAPVASKASILNKGGALWT